jgi:hypothetical protein
VHEVKVESERSLDDVLVRLNALAERLQAKYPPPQMRPTLTLIQGGGGDV